MNIPDKNNTDKVSGGETKPPQNTKKAKSKPVNSKIKIVWIIKVLFITLFLSFTMSIISEYVINTTHIIIAYALIVIILLISVVSDMIGTAATSSDEQPFLAMAARKVRGAKRAVSLSKSAEKVSSVCSDIIGDICGIVSGACGASIVAKQFIVGGTTEILVSVLFSAVIAALTVTGKAIGKTYAINNANDIVFGVAKMLSIFDKKN